MTDRIPDDVLDAVERDAREEAAYYEDMLADGPLPPSGALAHSLARATNALCAHYRASAPAADDAHPVPAFQVPHVREMSEEQARAVLREYPDADLSAFCVQSGKTVDELAVEETERTLREIERRAPVPASVPGVVWERANTDDCDGTEVLMVELPPTPKSISVDIEPSDNGRHKWFVDMPDDDYEMGDAPDLESAKAAAIEAAREVTRKLAAALGMRCEGEVRHGE